MITIRVRNHMRAANYVGKMGRRAGNMRPVFMVIQQDFRRIQRDQFATQGRRGGGGRWKDISDKWRNYKISRGFDPRIMHMTHALVDSLTKPLARGAYFRIRGNTMIMGTTLPYAAILDPERPIIGVRYQDEAEWADWMAIYIAHGFLPRTGLL
jgi:phage gpG-like protein